MSRAPTQPEHWQQALDAALREHGEPAARRSDAIPDDHLLRLAAGRADELDPAERSALLRAVAADPELSRLVAALSATFREENTQVDAKTDERAEPFRIDHESVEEAPPRVLTHRAWWAKPLYGTWAAAACLLVTLMVWEVASPGTTDPASVPGGGGEVRTLQTDPGRRTADDYWDEHERREAEAAQRFETARDIALIAVSAACLVLTVPVAWLALRPRPRNDPRTTPQHPTAP
ncbi:MAG: hypothetical protein AAGK09_09895 [Planctomycetota bacterium]